MRIKLIWVGRTKEQFVRDGIKKYLKLLTHFGDISITEIKAEKGRHTDIMIEKESRRILNLKLPYVLLDEKGKNLSTVAFTNYMRDRGSVNFVLGGAFGVSDEIKEKAQDCFALSKMTLTHEMSRLFLMEQIYRAFTIIQKRGYHH
jgi:23S rRNA (pseudouridine1915-N3)-methyltransferase